VIPLKTLHERSQPAKRSYGRSLGSSAAHKGLLSFGRNRVYSQCGAAAVQGLRSITESGYFRLLSEEDLQRNREFHDPLERGA